MLFKLSKNNLNLLRSNSNAIGFNLIRTLADKTSDNEKPKAKPIKKVNDDSVKQQPAKANTPENVVEKLGKPSKPSEKYQSPEYFSYNEYSYNDLFVDMEKYRNPQPKVK